MKPLTYGEYLKVEDLISLQRPKSDPPQHDELLFIIIHQTYELWFKQLLNEFDSVNASFREVTADPTARDAVYEAARLLRRCTEIARILVAQFTILETMLPTHFLAFRGRLGAASGFQSEQFRELEFLCGLKNEKTLHMHEPTPAMHDRLLRRLREPSVRATFFNAIAHVLSLPDVAGEDDSPGGIDATRLDIRARAILRFYSDERRYRDWIDVCERLTEFDELLIAWRLRHVQMVERMIGARTGTGGTGVSYLRATIDKKIFPEFWHARNMLFDV
jgi:tryptophan 2,3-dioxygenase